ncbi:YihY family inner membrane protein [Achromobacter sp. Marseille-Q4954]|uniref:YihY family inner membrane protein n=1 Tax=Achromobacter sp. Marseille-Q4954 TaxID=2942203 RepID=UPI00207392E2|nr:YihY family inner membrane protein [Achromobacter sp. Marseille-Q4954]
MNRPAEPAATTPAATEHSTSRSSWIARAGRVVRFSAERASEEKLLQVASSLTFTTVLAIVPMLAVVLSLFTAFPVFQEFRVALEDFLTNSLMPPSVSDNIMDYLNQFARQASRLTAIGGAFLLITSLLLIMTIDKAFNDIWHVTRQRPLRQRALVYWAIITLGPVVAGASLWATSFVARESLGLVRDVPEAVSVAVSFIPLVLTALGFAALFVMVPNREVLWRDALVGGCVTAIVLEIMKSAFAYYLTRFPTYTIIYGAFATLPIFLLWIYLSWLAVLLGAILASSAPLIRLGRWEINRYPGAPFVDAVDALRTLRQAQTANPPGLPANLLAAQLRLHQDELNEVLETLAEMGLATRSPEGLWVLTCDARKTSMEPVVDSFLLDRGQPRVRNDPEILRVASAVISQQNAPTLEEVCGEAQNTENGIAPVLQLEAKKN